MRRELLMPKLGLTMAEGTLVEWLVKPGQAFTQGQSLFVIESEKAAVEIEAEADGTLLETRAAPGATLAVGAPIGAWEDAAAPAPSPAPAMPGPQGQNEQPRIPVTPLARRIAAQRGLDLRTVQGSGPHGRIRARDLEGLSAAAPAGSDPEPIPEPPPAPAPRPSAGDPQRVAPSARERTVAQRLSTSKREIPHFYLAVEAEVTRLQNLRAELNAMPDGRRFTLNHFILAAVGRALQATPEANRVWTDEGILSFAQCDVGMAVHAERGLAVPVLRDVGRSSLAGIAAQADAAIALAHNGRLSAQDMAGGAITVSNAGMHDVTYMTSIIDPAQSMILGVGSMRALFRPDADGQPLLRREMGLVLSVDHRILDGVTSLRLLKRIVGHLEHPLGLLAS